MNEQPPDLPDTIAHPKKAAFLVAYVESGAVAPAARAASVDRRTHYDWLAADPDYAAAFEAAKEDAADLLESEARRRAREGLRRLKFDKYGDAVLDPETGLPYVEWHYSDTLLIFLLKGARPEKYKERSAVDVQADVLLRRYVGIDVDEV